MSSTNPYKRSKNNNDTPPSELIIGTHSGTFQADEALGVWLLRQLPQYKDSRVIRSRDNTVLSTCDIVLDVGGVYDHDKLKYDHHQTPYDERFSEGRCTKLSASGLIYRHYGKEVIKGFYPMLSTEHLDWAYEKMYDLFMEAIDAIDTGVEMADVCRYRDSTGLSKRVSRLNPRWNEDASVLPDERFQKASELCGEGFVDVLETVVESDLPAFDLVDTAMRNRGEVHPSAQIIKFESGGMPWKQHVYNLERKYDIDKPILFVLYTDSEGMWRVQAVTVEHKAFENRLGLPSSWRGLRDEELDSVSGIPGCVFVHANGFIGGNKTYQGVLKMAEVALSSQQ